MPARKVTYILSVTVPVVVVGVGIFKLHQPSHPHDPQILNTLEKPSTLPQQQKMSELPSRPVSLHIPSLKVTASVEPKGLNNLGEMDVPQKGDSISWYKFGYLPGALGNAVFAGHYLYNSVPAVFHTLPELKKGQVIFIYTKEKRQSYNVATSRIYNASEAVANVFGPSKSAQIQLVTCYGKWSESRQQYEKRLVVTAIFETEHSL